MYARSLKYIRNAWIASVSLSCDKPNRSEKSRISEFCLVSPHSTKKSKKLFSQRNTCSSSSMRAHGQSSAKSWPGPSPPRPSFCAMWAGRSAMAPMPARETWRPASNGSAPTAACSRAISPWKRWELARPRSGMPLSASPRAPPLRRSWPCSVGRRGECID